MTYFDHVRCSSCKAMLDPESLANRPGQGLSCPRCGAPLSMGDLFGLKDAFAEEDQDELSLDDVLSKMRAPTASVAPPDEGARPPAGRPAPAPAGKVPAKAAPAAKAAPGKVAPRQLTGPSAGGAPKPVPAKPFPGPSKGLPSKVSPAPAKAADTGGSDALAAMRALRDKKK